MGTFDEVSGAQELAFSLLQHPLSLQSALNSICLYMSTVFATYPFYESLGFVYTVKLLALLSCLL